MLAAADRGIAETSFDSFEQEAANVDEVVAPGLAD